MFAIRLSWQGSQSATWLQMRLLILTQNELTLGEWLGKQPHQDTHQGGTTFVKEPQELSLRSELVGMQETKAKSTP
jgi:hypothetical protein